MLNLIESQLQTQIDKLREKEDRTEGDNAILDRTITDLEKITSRKAQGAIFRSKARWYNEGEHNTKYFFSLEKSRSVGKNISVLIDDSGREITDQKSILEEMRTFYAELYSKDDSVKFVEINEKNIKISDEERHSLEGQLTLGEISKVAKELNRNKSPGTDGLPIELYGMFWRKISNFLLKALNMAYSTGTLHKSARQGVISLIPKKGKDTRYIRNLRPITLLNTDYKILEKCLANRLKPVLESIINEDQKGFMANRSISNNIRRILDSVIVCEQKDIPLVILSIDAEKAFDRIEISSLLGAMRYFGIGESFQKWTSVCFNGAEASVLNFGHISEKFDITRGVKQGGCCSAFYFLLLIETLANKLRNNQNLRGLDVNEINKLLGQFADDLDLYLWGDRQNVKLAIKTISDFGKSSGMKINVNKSTIMKLGRRKDFDIDLNIKEIEQVNVLGVEILSYIDDQKLLAINYDKLIIKAKAVLNQWQGRNLSLLGKVLVINSLIGSLFVYKMTVLPAIPEKYIKSLNEIFNQFLWNHRRPKIPIEILQLPKFNGGAGLVSLKNKDISLKFGWVKNVLSDSFIEKLAYESINRCLGRDIWRCNLHTADVETLRINNSFWNGVIKAWRGLNYNKFVPPDEFPYQFIWYNSHIRISNKPFLFHNLYNNGLSEVLQLFQADGTLKTAADIAAEFMCPILQANQLITAIPKEWRRIDQIQEPETVSNLIDVVSNIQKPTAYAYRQMMSGHSAIEKCQQKWSRKITNINTEDISVAFKNIYRHTNYTKLRSFQFRLRHSALVFNTQLKHWKIKDSNLCSLCNKEPEDVLHFYWECEHIQKVWVDLKKHTNETFQACVNISAKTIICGNVCDDFRSPANFVFMVAKMLLYSKRCLGEICNSKQIIEYYQKCRLYEEFNAQKNNNLKAHFLKWKNNDEIDEYISNYLFNKDQCCREDG